MTTTDLSLPLPTPQQPNPPPRPTRQDPHVIRAIVARMLPDIIEWMGDDWRESERDDVIAHLTDAVEYASDGYDRARRLDSRWSWTGDSELVEILDGHDGHRELDEAIRAWVAANGIRMRFAVGDQVRFGYSTRAPRTNVGEVIEVDASRARYTVRPSDAEDLAKKGIGFRGYVVPQEACEPVGEVAA